MPSIQKEQLISSSYSHLDGASFGALLTEQIMTLDSHQEVSGQDLTYFDDEKNEKYVPYVIEPSLGADRVVLAFLCAAYDEEDIGTQEKPDVQYSIPFPSSTCTCKDWCTSAVKEAQ